MATLKWKLNNREYAYITDENGSGPFIYNADTISWGYKDYDNTSIVIPIETQQTYEGFYGKEIWVSVQAYGSFNDEDRAAYSYSKSFTVPTPLLNQQNARVIAKLDDVKLYEKL